MYAGQYRSNPIVEKIEVRKVFSSFVKNTFTDNLKTQSNQSFAAEAQHISHKVSCIPILPIGPWITLNAATKVRLALKAFPYLYKYLWRSNTIK